MLGQKPVRAVGLNLGLRLYLVLVAIFLPTFLSYYVYTIRTIEILHETEVEDVIRMTSLRIEDWVNAFAPMEAPGEKEREAISQELKKIIAERADDLNATTVDVERSHADEGDPSSLRWEEDGEIVVDQLSAAIAKDGYRAQSWVVAVVTSYPFTHRRVKELNSAK